MALSLVLLCLLAGTSALVPVHQHAFSRIRGGTSSSLCMSLVDRRRGLSAALTSSLLLSAAGVVPPAALANSAPVGSSADAAALADAVISALSNPPESSITRISLESPRKYAGLELYDIKLGNPHLRSAVAIRSVRPDGEGARAGAEPGMVVLDFTTSRSVVERIAGPYPIELKVCNLARVENVLAAGGDGAIGGIRGEGQRSRTAQQALELAKESSVGGGTAAPAGGGGPSFGERDPSILNQERMDADALSSGDFLINVSRSAKGSCAVKSRKGDTMEIRYEARVGDQFGRIYDASDFRGTGQPYLFSLGNGELIRGVDLGTYDMCPGEVRELTIPPILAYGQRGSKLFKIPQNSTLFWRIELVALNFIREGQNNEPRNELYEGLTKPP